MTLSFDEPKAGKIHYGYAPGTRIAARVYVPTDDGMVEIGPETTKYVTLSDFEEQVKRSQLEVDMARKNGADISQREARWMMIEARLRKTIADHAHNELVTDNHVIRSRIVLEILNSDPPIGNGFQSVKGLDPNRAAPSYREWDGYPTAGELKAATDVIEIPQGAESKLKEDANHVRAGIEPDHM